MLAAVFCVALQAAAIAHVDFTAHGVCPEHGELTELVPQPQPAGAAVAVDPHPGGVAGLHVVSAVLTQPDDHCLLAELVRQAGPAHAAPVLRPLAQEVWRVPSTEAGSEERPTWLLRLAPKQSPPL